MYIYMYTRIYIYIHVYIYICVIIDTHIETSYIRSCRLHVINRLSAFSVDRHILQPQPGEVTGSKSEVSRGWILHHRPPAVVYDSGSRSAA